MNLFQVFDTVTKKWKLASSSVIWEQETPTGTINGSNQLFTLSATPISAKSLFVYLNGIHQPQTAYSVDLGNHQFTMVTAPKLGQDIYVAYMK